MDQPTDPSPPSSDPVSDPIPTPPASDPTPTPTETTPQAGTSTVPSIRPFSASAPLFTAGSTNPNTTITLVEDVSDDDDANSIITVSTADSDDDRRVRVSQFDLPPVGGSSTEKPMEWDPFETPSAPPPIDPIVPVAFPEPQLPDGPRPADIQVIQVPMTTAQPAPVYAPSGVQVMPPGVLPPSYPGMPSSAPPYSFGQGGYTPSAFSTAPAQPIGGEKSMPAQPSTSKSMKKDLEKNNGSDQTNAFRYLGACSVYSIYWCCMLLLFVIPLGGLLIFFWWSSRIQVSLASASAVSASARAPDANSMLFNMTIKVRVNNKNSSPIQIKEIVTDAWFGGHGGIIRKKEIGNGRIVGTNMTVQGRMESTFDVPVQMRFEASTDPQFKALEEVVRGCGRVSGGKREIEMQVKVGMSTVVGSKSLRTGVSDTMRVACPLPDDFKSDLITKVVDDLKKKDGGK